MLSEDDKRWAERIAGDPVAHGDIRRAVKLLRAEVERLEDIISHVVKLAELGDIDTIKQVKP